MKLRNYKRGDEEAILDLFQICFGKPLSEDYWRWRFLENPFDPEPMIKLLWDQQKLVIY